MNKQILEKYYLKQRKSVSDISKILNKSESGINYWIKKHGIPKRTISDAIYLKHNPKGDPFELREIKTLELAELKGFGLGLFWGEGNKKNKTSVRLGNTDHNLIKKFIEFLVKICKINKNDLRFSLQIFSDINPIEAKNFWKNNLKIKERQFSKKITVSISKKAGNYKNKMKYGVLTVYYHNKKLRDIIVSMLPK